MKILTRSAAADLSRAFVSDIEVRSDGEGRTVHGIVVPFNKVAKVRDFWGPSYDEAFQKGAFTKTIAERGNRVKLLSQHDSQSNPLGRATLLREDEAGLYGEFRVARTAAGDEALELIREGALDSFSVGFKPIKEETRGDAKNPVLWRTEVAMREASLVTFPAYEDALVGGVRDLVGGADLAKLTPEDRAELLRMLRESGDIEATPNEEPAGENQDTAPAAVRADEEPTPEGHSAQHVHYQLRARARREGGPLS